MKLQWQVTPGPVRATFIQVAARINSPRPEPAMPPPALPPETGSPGETRLMDPSEGWNPVPIATPLPLTQTCSLPWVGFEIPEYLRAFRQKP